MAEQEITCQQRDDLVENNQPVSVYSSLTNYVGGEILDPRLPGHTATTWCDASERPFLREILDAEGCRHWRIVDEPNRQEPNAGRQGSEGS